MDFTFLKTFKDFKDPWGPCLLTRVTNLFAQIMTIGTWGIYDVLISLRSLCTIAHWKGLVPKVSKLVSFLLYVQY